MAGCSHLLWAHTLTPSLVWSAVVVVVVAAVAVVVVVVVWVVESTRQGTEELHSVV